MSLFFIVQNLWFSGGSNTESILKPIVSGLIAGVISGFVFGLFIGLFQSSKFVDITTKIDIEPDENISFQTPANHFKGMGGIGGKLYLTNKRLVFKSHKANFQNHELSINLPDITSVERYRSLSLINNGLRIKLKDNGVEKFVVEKAAEWKNKLK